jgi:NADH-ubiquinone oxidoreductase chain 5
LTGFYSKEVVLEIAFSKFSLNSFFIYWLGVIAAFITSFYSIRLVYLVFFSTTNSFSRALFSSHESVSFISYVLSFLGVISIFVGFLFKDLFIGLGTDFWNNSVFQLYTNTDILTAEFLDFSYKLIPLVFSLLGMFSSLSVYYLFYRMTFITIFNKFFNLLYFFLVKKWYFDLIYNNLFVFNLLKSFYSVTFKLIDRGLIEFFGPLSVVRLTAYFSRALSFVQTGYMYNYIFIIIVSIIVFIKLIFSFEIFNYFDFNLLICFLSVMLFIILKKK